MDKFFKGLIDLLNMLFLGKRDRTHDNKPKPPKDEVKKGLPTITDGVLRVDGKRVMSMGVYDLLVNADGFPDREIDNFFKRFAGTGCNLMRVWVKMYFRPTDWQPWAWTSDGKFDLSVPNQNLYNRMKMISDAAHKHGVCIAWTLIDFCSVRQGFGWKPDGKPYDVPDSLCPSRHVDPLEHDKDRRMMTQNGYYDENDSPYMNGAPRARRIYKCKYNVDDDPKSGCSTTEIGCRLHPAWWEMFRRTVNVAKLNNDIVYVASEMCSGDRSHDEWDNQAMVEFTRSVVDFIHAIYPECITGTSLADINKDAYIGVDIADIHGLGYGTPCDPSRIPESAINADNAGIFNIICYNSDGCMFAPRYDIQWMKDAINNAWIAGGFFETKADWATLQSHQYEIMKAFSECSSNQ